MNKALLDHYRLPEEFSGLLTGVAPPEHAAPGFFTLGADLICFGRSSLPVAKQADDDLPDAEKHIVWNNSTWQLPFDPSEVAAMLRNERYVQAEPPLMWKRAVRQMYYTLRPLLPVDVRRHLQRAWLSRREAQAFPRWPVDRTVDRFFEHLMRLMIQVSPEARVPFIWFWPEGHASCALMTHDVETHVGLEFTQTLMRCNDDFGIKSSFQLIPDARYTVTPEVVRTIRDRGFEVNVHDLKHDGHLFATEQGFRQAAEQINAFAQAYGSNGFRSGVLYRNQEWFDALHMSYDMSVPNVAKFDPQPGGCCTITPYFLGDLLELPVTTTQDYSLFHVLGTYSQDLWNKEIAEITSHHGLLNFIVHPDYLDSPQAMTAYKSLLATLSGMRRTAGLWIPLPGELNTWWRQRHGMHLVRDGDGWTIEGAGADRARLAYAFLEDDVVQYCLA